MNKEEVFNNNINLAYDMAHKLYKNTKDVLEFDDLQQICLMSLWKAVNSYTINGNCKFSTFAVKWIEKEVYKKYKKEKMIKEKNISIEETINTNQDIRIIDILENKSDSFESIDSSIDLKLYANLCKGKRKDIVLDYIDGMKKEEISTKYKLTKRRINQIISDFILEVKKYDN